MSLEILHVVPPTWVEAARKVLDSAQRSLQPRESVIVIRPKRPVQIQRRQIPYWLEHGWLRKGSDYEGTYKTPFGAFLGRVEDHGFGRIRFYIKKPPSVLEGSGHWPCFRPCAADLFEIHMKTLPKDVSSGIIAIEKLILSAFTGRY